jgi:SAM-dependent methyltransferase
MDGPKLYRDLASWWPLMSTPDDYAEEAAVYARTMLAAAGRPIRTMVELGSGGGNNASHLKHRFTLTLVEPSAGMLDVSRRLNPECEHVVGDMRTVRLGRRFDAVFVHDAVMYMTTPSELRAAIETAFVHCEPGGVALFCPDYVRENFRQSTDHGGHDHPDGRGLRFVEWVWDPDPADQQYIADYGYLLRERDGSIHAVNDRHIEGLFARADWLAWLSEAGFDPAVIPIELSDMPPGRYEVFVATRLG